MHLVPIVAEPRTSPIEMLPSMLCLCHAYLWSMSYTPGTQGYSWKGSPTFHAWVTNTRTLQVSTNTQPLIDVLPVPVVLTGASAQDASKPLTDSAQKIRLTTGTVVLLRQFCEERMPSLYKPAQLATLAAPAGSTSTASASASNSRRAFSARPTSSRRKSPCRGEASSSGSAEEDDDGDDEDDNDDDDDDDGSDGDDGDDGEGSDDGGNGNIGDDSSDNNIDEYNNANEINGTNKNLAGGGNADDNAAAAPAGSASAAIAPATARPEVETNLESRLQDGSDEDMTMAVLRAEALQERATKKGQVKAKEAEATGRSRVLRLRPK
eukprot:3432211-Pleurochrysis_carterae.AAC.1